MSDTGKKDKGKRRQQKKQGMSLKEKRRIKREKRAGVPSEIARKN